jgi:hypothetical protein
MKIGVVAHESRIRQAHQLVQNVHADYISVDRNHMLGPNKNHRHVWEHLNAIAGRDEWCIVLEDDAIVLEDDAIVGYDFRRQAAQVLFSCPTNVDVVSLYLGRMRPPQWQERVKAAVNRANAYDATWIVGDVALHAVALAMIGENVAKMLWSIRNCSRPPDESVTHWCRMYGHRIGYCFPSIVQHGDLPTLIKHPDGQERENGRVAWRFGMRNTWHTKPVVL